MDTLGQILWFTVFVTPFLTIPLAWRLKDISKTLRIIIGLLIAIILSSICYLTSLALIFSNGMGS